MESENDQEGFAGSGLEAGASAEPTGGSADVGAVTAGEIKFDHAGLGLKTQQELDAFIQKAKNYDRLIAVYNKKGERRNRELSEREAKLKAREEEWAAREAAHRSGGAGTDLPYHRSIAERYKNLGIKAPSPEELNDDTRIVFTLLGELADKVGGLDELKKTFGEIQKGHKESVALTGAREEEGKIRGWEKEFYSKYPEAAKRVKGPRGQEVVFRMVMDQLGEDPAFDDWTDDEFKDNLQAALLEHYGTLGFSPPPPPFQVGSGAGGAGRGKPERELSWDKPEDREAILALSKKDALSGGGP